MDRIGLTIARLIGAARDRRGTAAVEFALVLPVLLATFFGTLQAGFMMFSYNSMVSAARDTSRAMATCSQSDTGVLTTEALSNLPQWVSATDWTITPTPNPGGATVNTTISVDPAKASIIHWFPFSMGMLTASVTMEKEPLAFGGATCS